MASVTSFVTVMRKLTNTTMHRQFGIKDTEPVLQMVHLLAPHFSATSGSICFLKSLIQSPKKQWFLELGFWDWKKKGLVVEMNSLCLSIPLSLFVIGIEHRALFMLSRCFELHPQPWCGDPQSQIGGSRPAGRLEEKSYGGSVNECTALEILW